MKLIQNQTFDAERAFYGVEDVRVENCSFDGPADGESAFKECRDVYAGGCFFNLRYPFWHDKKVKICDSHMTENCRAALWYTEDAEILNTKLHGIKALRECKDVKIEGCDIVSAEFGWMSKNVTVTDTRAEGEYFMFRSKKLRFENFTFKGKYSFQYIKHAIFENCTLDTKDAFWHAEDVVVRNCLVKGEYLAWYAKDITFENCKIIGTQPFCYCDGLKLINCEMEGCDLSFEKSYVEATVTTNIDSIKNPKGGFIEAPSAGEIIMDDAEAKCRLIIGEAVKL